MGHVLGIDLGGTNVKTIVVDADDPSHIEFDESSETRAELGRDAVLERIVAGARRAIGAVRRVERVGVGAPGPLDIERGRAVRMPNLPGWEDVPIVAELEARLGLPVALINDARALTLAEHTLGAGRGTEAMACFALGTGVGGGVVVGGRLLLGMNGTVGELGHQTIEPAGLTCTCGSRGCLEQYASGPAIARAAGTPTAREVVAAAQAGDERALAVLETTGTALGIGIANVVLAIGPARVVVGGGVAQAGDLLLEPARRELFRRVRVMPVDRVEIVRGELGPHAGALGAALWALTR